MQSYLQARRFPNFCKNLTFFGLLKILAVMHAMLTLHYMKNKNEVALQNDLSAMLKASKVSFKLKNLWLETAQRVE